MNREIKFRGQDIDCNKWRYGSLVKVRENDGYLLYYIVDEENQQWIVFSESIGQYTGLKDKNGKEIFEGDVLDFVAFDRNGINTRYKGYVLFKDAMYLIDLIPNDEEVDYYILNFAYTQDDELEVIGNIYENPELMEVK